MESKVSSKTPTVQITEQHGKTTGAMPDWLLDVVAAVVNRQVHDYADSHRKHPSVADTADELQAGAEAWLQTAPSVLARLFTKVVLFSELPAPHEQGVQKRLVRAAGSGAAMCIMSGVELTLVPTPVPMLHATARRKAGDSVVNVYAKFLGGSSDSVDNYFDAQAFSEEQQGLTDADGMVVVSADNIGCQNMKQKQCQADKKLSIKIWTAMCSVLLSVSNFIQYHPLANPSLWLYKNRYTDNPTVVNAAESKALRSESRKHFEYFFTESDLLCGTQFCPADKKVDTALQAAVCAVGPAAPQHCSVSCRFTEVTGGVSERKQVVMKQTAMELDGVGVEVVTGAADGEVGAADWHDAAYDLAQVLGEETMIKQPYCHKCKAFVMAQAPAPRPNNTDFKNWKVHELKAELTSRGAPTDGKKAELVQRLQQLPASAPVGQQINPTGTTKLKSCPTCGSKLSETLKSAVSELVSGSLADEQVKFFDVHFGLEKNRWGEEVVVQNKSQQRLESDELHPQLHHKCDYERLVPMVQRRSHPLLSIDPGSAAGQKAICDDFIARVGRAGLQHATHCTMTVPTGAALPPGCTVSQTEAQTITVVAQLKPGDVREVVPIGVDGGILPGVVKLCHKSVLHQKLVTLPPGFHTRALDLRTVSKVSEWLGYREFVEIHMQTKDPKVLAKMITVTNRFPFF